MMTIIFKCRNANDYAALFLSFWVYTLGVPAVAILTLLHTYKGCKNDILGVLVSCKLYV